MNNIFGNTSALWVRYEKYEWKTGKDGVLYLTPSAKAKPEIYDPLEDAQTLVLDALNVGRLCMSREPAKESEIQDAIMRFTQRHGLMGLMTALPTTADFMRYESVYLPKNQYIREETMETEAYLALFFPFEKPDVVKRGVESLWALSGDNAMKALALAMSDKPAAVNMEFQREYAERYDWLRQIFRDWAFIVMTSIFYYEEEELSEETRKLMRQGMAAFGGNAPTYHIALLEKPTLVWDFHSLVLAIQMMFSFMLTDDAKPLRMCRHCGKIFVANRVGTAFCGPQCKNRYNVYKSRAKSKGR